jgi:hypothetical protein
VAYSALLALSANAVTPATAASGLIRTRKHVESIVLENCRGYIIHLRAFQEFRSRKSQLGGTVGLHEICSTKIKKA